MKQGHAKNSIHNLRTESYARNPDRYSAPQGCSISGTRHGDYVRPGSLGEENRVKVSRATRCLCVLEFGREKSSGPWLRGRADGGRDAGLDPSVIPWLKKRDIAIMAAIIRSTSRPRFYAGSSRFRPVYLGIHLFDNCDLEALADAAAARKRWSFS